MATIFPLYADLSENTSSIGKIPAIWIYSVKLDSLTRIGVWAMTDLADMDEGQIVAHENVMPEKLERIIAHQNAGGTLSSPVLLTYRPNEKLDKLIHDICLVEKAHLYCKTNKYNLWRIADPNVLVELQDTFRDIGVVYIADGHHRLAAAHQVHRNSKQLISSLYVPSDQLKISAFHRLIRMDKPVDRILFMDQISIYFKVIFLESEQPFRPDRSNQLGLFFQGSWYRLDLKDDVADRDLPDASILQELVLAPILGIYDPISDERLENFPDPAFGDLVSALKIGENILCFTLFPIAVSEFLAAADSHQILPPKSTWIEPKIPGKLLVQDSLLPENRR